MKQSRLIHEILYDQTDKATKDVALLLNFSKRTVPPSSGFGGGGARAPLAPLAPLLPSLMIIPVAVHAHSKDLYSHSYYSAWGMCSITTYLYYIALTDY